MGGVGRLPAALVAPVLGHPGRLFRPARSAELSFVRRAAATGPAVRSRLGLATFGAELAGGRRAAGTLPALCRDGLRLTASRAESPGVARLPAGAGPAGGRSRPGGLAHLIEVLHLHAAHLSGQSHPHKRHGRAGVWVGCRRFHRLGLSPGQRTCRAGGVGVGRLPAHLLLHLADLFFNFFIRTDRVDAEGHDLNPSEISPFGGENLLQDLRQLGGVAGQHGIADAHGTELGKGGLEGRHQVRSQRPIQRRTRVFLRDVAADIGVKQEGVHDPVAVFPKTADGDIHVDGSALIHHPESDRFGGAVFVAHDLLGIEIVDPLVLGRLSAEGEALSHVLKHTLDRFAQIPGENAGLCGHIVGVFPRLGAHVHHLALLHNEHTLAVCHRNDRAVGDDVVVPLAVAGAACDLLFSLDCQDVRRDGFAIEKFLPLIGQRAADRSECSFDQSHRAISSLIFVLRPQEHLCLSIPGILYSGSILRLSPVRRPTRSG